MFNVVARQQRQHKKNYKAIVERTVLKISYFCNEKATKN